MGLQVLASDRILRMNDFGLLGMIQNHEAQANTNPEEIFELGRTSKVDTSFELETQGSFDVIAIGNTAGLMARMMPVRNPTTLAFSGMRFSGASNKNAYCFTEADMTEMQFDLVVHERPDQKSFSRSHWYPRCFVQNISGRADAAGNATETFQWGGNFLATFNTPYHDIVSVFATVTNSTTVALTGTAPDSSTHTLVYVYVDDRRFRNDTTADATTFTHTGTTLTLNTTEGYAIPADALVRAVFYKTSSPSTTFPSVQASERGTTAFYVKGYQVNLYLGPADPDAPLDSEKWLRAQNCDYNIDLRSEQLRQLSLNTAGSAIYCRVPTLPFTITANVTAYEADLIWWRQIMTKTPGTDVYTDSYDFDPSSLKGDPSNPLRIVIRYYTKAGVLLQETQFLDMVVETVGERTAVGGRAERTLSLRGTALKVCGYNA